jgi:hypothetical protein
MGSRRVHQRQVAIRIILDFVEQQVEARGAVWAELPKRLHLDREGKQRAQASEVEIGASVDHGIRHGCLPTAGRREADGEQVLSHGAELRRRELAPPIRPARRIEASQRIQ